MNIKLRVFSSLVLFLSMLAIAIPSFAQVQEFEASGIVKDETGMPVIGATVMVPKTTIGVVTGYDGDFKLKVKKGAKLRFSYIGYKTIELLAAKNMTVKLEPEATAIDDVVVVGYMPRKVANTSASVVKIKGEELASKPNVNPLDAIQGKVSGLQITSISGEPSADLRIQLHGQGSFRGVGYPLVIVDGIPSTLRNIRAMNPNDIADIQFLKDAAATSIYGSRAANGVIYITTKRGSNSEGATITVRSQYGVSTLANTDYFDQLMSADELLRYYEDTGIYSQDEINNKLKPYFKGKDFSWYKYIYQPASTYSADISISGGTPKLNYYISGGTQSQDGLKAGSGYKKYFGRLNLNLKLNDYIKLSLNSSVNHDQAKLPPIGGRSTDGLAVLNSPYSSPFDSETGEEQDTYFIGRSKRFSRKHNLETHPFYQDETLITNNATAIIRPLKNLTIRSLVGIEMAYKDAGSIALPSFKAGNGEGGASRTSGASYNFSTTNTASYMFDIGRHNVTALLGQEYLNISAKGFSAQGQGLTDDRLHLLNHLTKDKSIGEVETSFATLSYFSQLSYNYSERYFLDFMLRNDQTSNFSKNNRSGWFWSVGLLWKAKNEDFLRDVKWLNKLDIKASYGTQGQPTTSNLNDFYVKKNGQKKGAISIGTENYGNPNLTWEMQDKLTIGTKVRLWNKLEFNLEYYRRITSGLHFERAIAGSKGVPSVLQNVGKFQNQGLDLLVQLDVLRERDYALSTYLNFNYNQDKTLELYDGLDVAFDAGNTFIVGQPINYFLPIYKGVNTNTGKPEWYLPGNDYAKTRKDDQALTTEFNDNLTQNTGIRKSAPINGGWGVSARWKNFYMNADFSFILGKYSLSIDKTEFEEHTRVQDPDGNWNASRKLFDYWKEPGQKAEFPSLDYVTDKTKDHKSTQRDSKLLENASFMRMKTLTFGYRIPKKTLEAMKIFSSAKVYFSGRNLLTFTKYQGSDPEIPSNSMAASPNTKQFSFGIELGF